jgi:2-haloacid dehalogenase
LLDVFETLFSAANLATAFAACGLDPAFVSCWVARIMQNGIALTAAHDYRRFADVARDALVALAPDRIGEPEVQKIMGALVLLDPHADVADALRRLRAAGVRVFTLSSAEKGLAEALFARAGLEGLVDGYLSVETVRRWKPAPEPYAYGVAQVGWPAGQVALISAHEWDIHGARHAGLQTGYIQRRPRLPHLVFDSADASGDHLLAVVEQLLNGKPAAPMHSPHAADR